MKIEQGAIVMASVLIVDDDLDIREALASGLDIPGINLAIMTAENAITAIQIAKTELPDLILLDFNMPGGNGFIVAKEIRSLPELADTKIIMLTAQDTRRNKWESVEHAIDVFVSKPFDLSEIEAHMYSLLITTASGGRRTNARPKPGA